MNALSDLQQPEHVEFICHKFLPGLAEPFSLGEDVGHVSGSTGASLYPLDGQTSEELTCKADQAMHAAKQTGRNRFNYFTQERDAPLCA